MQRGSLSLTAVPKGRICMHERIILEEIEDADLSIFRDMSRLYIRLPFNNAGGYDDVDTVYDLINSVGKAEKGRGFQVLRCVLVFLLVSTPQARAL